MLKLFETEPDFLEEEALEPIDESLKEINGYRYIEKDLLKKWKTSNEVHIRKEFKRSGIPAEEFKELKEAVDTLRDESKGFGEYKKALNKVCKFCNARTEGIIITKLKVKRDKDGDGSIYMQYSENNRPITLPAGTKLYHVSHVGGITKLQPKFRGKKVTSYLYDRPRIYFSLTPKMPRTFADYGFGKKMHRYVTTKDITTVYVDPLVWSRIQACVYVVTDTPIPVKEITDDKTTKTDAKHESVNMILDMIDELGLEVVDEEPINEIGVAAAAGIAAGTAAAAGAGSLIGSKIKKAKDNKFQEQMEQSPTVVNALTKTITEVQSTIKKVVSEDVMAYFNPSTLLTRENLKKSGNTYNFKSRIASINISNMAAKYGINKDAEHFKNSLIMLDANVENENEAIKGIKETYALVVREINTVMAKLGNKVTGNVNLWVENAVGKGDNIVHTGTYKSAVQFDQMAYVVMTISYQDNNQMEVTTKAARSVRRAQKIKIGPDSE